MKLVILGLLLGICFAYENPKHWEYDIHRCDNMTDAECIHVAQEVFNYTVHDIRRMTTVMKQITERRVACKIAGVCPTAEASIKVPEPCANGQAAGTWQCNNIDLLSFISLAELGSSSNADGNDIWGWTNPNDPAGGTKRYAITGQTDGSSIVDVTNPENPDVLCFIPSRVSTLTIWRDIKIVYNSNNVAYAAIVADRSGQGLQYAPLENIITKCRNSRIAPQPYRAIEGIDFGWIGSGVYTGGTNTHNIVGSDRGTRAGNVVSTGNRVYLVGSNSCSGGPLAVDFSEAGTTNALSPPPSFGGCFSSDGYSHDAECWIYGGPDERYTGHEICVGYNENSITIIDYDNLNSPVQLSRLTYSSSRYTHQGWRTSNEEYLLMNDELDESARTVPSQTTYVVNIQSLTNPILMSWYSGIQSIDHNLYIKNYNGRDFAIESNYRAGLRVLSIDESQFNTQSVLSETGFFKTWQGSLATSFNGAWSSYPYFEDPSYPGLVVVQDIEQGLFVLDISNALD